MPLAIFCFLGFYFPVPPKNAKKEQEALERKRYLEQRQREEASESQPMESDALFRVAKAG